MSGRTAVKTQPQVFLSFSLRDHDVADEVARTLAESGVIVARMDQLAPSGEYTDVVRRALHASAAVVVVLPRPSRRREVPASVLFEIGAAVGADKPIFVVTDSASGGLPFNAPNLRLLPLSRVDEIVRHLGDD